VQDDLVLLVELDPGELFGVPEEREQLTEIRVADGLVEVARASRFALDRFAVDQKPHRAC
jgi:hypothetical protein